MTIRIVSGLERSGTSLLMQILKAGGVPVAYNETREADENNPKGYFELEKGKIINKLENNEFDFIKYEGKYIKITAFGLRYLQDKKCNIIFSERKLDEIIDSMEKMSNKDFDREESKSVLWKLLNDVQLTIHKNSNWNCIFINYNTLVTKPEQELKKIKEFIGEFNIKKAKKVIDKKLYRNRR